MQPCLHIIFQKINAVIQMVTSERGDCSRFNHQLDNLSQSLCGRYIMLLAFRCWEIKRKKK